LRERSKRADTSANPNWSGQESGGYSMIAETVTLPRTAIQEIIEKLDTIIEKLPKE